MNETINTIISRRSVRCFEEQKISTKDLELIVKSGTYAPSALNMQSGKIIVINDQATINLLKTIGTNVSPKHTDPFYGAPNIILVLVKKDSYCPIQDGSVIMENMMLACRSLNIGCCWINCLKDILLQPNAKELSNKINPNNEYIAVAGLVLGYPKDNLWPDEKPRKVNYVEYI